MSDSALFRMNFVPLAMAVGWVEEYLQANAENGNPESLLLRMLQNGEISAHGTEFWKAQNVLLGSAEQRFGFRSRDIKPADWIGCPRVEWKNCAMSIGDAKITNVLVDRVSLQRLFPIEERQEKPTSRARNQCESALLRFIDHVGQRKPASKDKIRKWFVRNISGLTDYAFNKIWDKLAPIAWRGAGRPRAGNQQEIILKSIDFADLLK